MSTVLEVKDLRIDMPSQSGTVSPVGPIDFKLGERKCLGIVGESGSGKSLTLKAVLGLLPNGLNQGGGKTRILHDGILVDKDPEEIRGQRIALISQEPGAALDPLVRVGDLIAEVIRTHRKTDWQEAKREAVDLMRQVGIPDPEERSHAWPHELSGGLKQRIVISMALASESDILFCDEPTTALDVTIQAQIVRLLKKLQETKGLSLIFVTHDLALVEQVADDLAIMYAGQIVEAGKASAIFENPRHPYTRALLEAAPDLANPNARLTPIPGSPPAPNQFPPGCRFAPRCKFASANCVIEIPTLKPVDGTSFGNVACFNWREAYGAAS